MASSAGRTRSQRGGAVKAKGAGAGRRAQGEREGGAQILERRVEDGDLERDVEPLGRERGQTAQARRVRAADAGDGVVNGGLVAGEEEDDAVDAEAAKGRGALGGGEGDAVGADADGGPAALPRARDGPREVLLGRRLAAQLEDASAAAELARQAVALAPRGRGEPAIADRAGQVAAGLEEHARLDRAGGGAGHGRALSEGRGRMRRRRPAMSMTAASPLTEPSMRRSEAVPSSFGATKSGIMREA